MPVKKADKLDKIIRKLTSLEKKVNHIERIERKIESEQIKVEKQEAEIKEEEKKIERTLLKIGTFTFKRKHLLEIVRGTAGAFLGVGLGKNLLSFTNLAETLPWWNILGILAFILAISLLLIYKNEKDFIKKEGVIIVWKRLFLLYLIALVVELFALWLFGGLPSDPVLLTKTLIIGSYTAMAGAVSFTIV